MTQRKKDKKGIFRRTSEEWDDTEEIPEELRREVPKTALSHTLPLEATEQQAAEEEEPISLDGSWDDGFRVEESVIRREKQKARQLRASQWWKNLRAQGKCHYCGKSVPPGELTMDHIVPISRGGRSIPSNIVPCCKECNTHKRSQLPIEWKH